MEGLKTLRAQKGWSQAKLAVEAGMDPSTVNQIETGARRPNTKTLEKLAAALDAEIADLFRGYELPPKGQAPLPLEDRGQEQRGAPFFEAWASYMRRRAREWERALEEDGDELFGEPEFVFDALYRNAQVQTEAGMLFEAVHEAVFADAGGEAALDGKAAGYPADLSEERRRTKLAVDEALLTLRAVRLAGMQDSYLELLAAANKWDERAEAAWKAAGEEVERRRLARAWERSQKAAQERKSVAVLPQERRSA